MNYRLIAVVSEDGFIARFSGDIPSKWTSKEEQRLFKKDIKKCEWSVMGRITHDLSYNKNRKRIIFTRSIETYRFINQNHIYFNPKNMSFNKIINLIKPKSNICILGGTDIYDYFYNNGLINEIIITIEPIILGTGIKLFSNIKWKYFFDFLIKKEFKIINSIQINTKGARYYHFSKN